MTLLQADWRPRLAVPALVAALFALALGVAVEPTHVPLLGFLSVVCVLCMSASASLLSIAGEREVFDHERQPFLSVPHYLLAKFLVTVVVGVLQTLLFFGALWLSRTVLGRQSFHATAWAVAILSVTSTAGTSLGLCLSALAGRKKETATFLLPLVMIVQLVFSVPVASPVEKKVPEKKRRGDEWPVGARWQATFVGWQFLQPMGAVVNWWSSLNGS